MSHENPILETRELRKHFPIRKLFQPERTVKALDGVSLSLQEGKTLAVVGESGCGKSTLAKVLLGIEPRTSGDYKLLGQDAGQMDPVEFRKTIQMIFQDPYSSLNPRKRAWEIISEPWRINLRASTEECRAKALEVMAQVGLRSDFADRYPHMFSGGQRQRIGIARALVMKPKVLICDEPVSALDVSIQAQVLNLLLELQTEFKLSYLFISHDLSVVRHIADEVAVMYLGKVVEHGRRDHIFGRPVHPYTQALLGSTPNLRAAIAAGGDAAARRKRVVLQGEPPSPLNPPSGCAFHPRCAYAEERCRIEAPVQRPVLGRMTACHLAESVQTAPSECAQDTH
jgi:dipeptide transport system ATP-binding protein